jgi:hypothetical protein
MFSQQIPFNLGATPMSSLPEFPSPEQFQPGGAAPQGGQIAISFDDSDATLIYANMLRLHSSPEDFAIDLSYIPNPALIQNRPLKVTNRVILSPANAKRLLGMLSQGVKRHEEQFGTIELDPKKRKG